VALLSETHLKPRASFFIPNYHFYRNDRFPKRKVGTAVAVRKCIPHKHADLSSPVSSEAVEVCILIGNSDVLFAAAYNINHQATLGMMRTSLSLSRYW
jgi:hypothetical protein